MRERMISLALLTLVAATACTRPDVEEIALRLDEARGSVVPQGSIRIAALDCRFDLPNQYVVGENGRFGIRLWDERMRQTGSIMIGPIPSEDGMEPPSLEDAAAEVEWESRLETLEAFDRGHLRVTRSVHRTGGLVGDVALSTIETREERVALFGDAASLTDAIVDQCLETVHPGVLAAHDRRDLGCAFEIEQPVLLETAASGARLHAFALQVEDGESRSGWSVLDVDSGSLAAQVGLREQDFVPSVCGVPHDEFVRGGWSVCCARGDRQTLVLEVDRPGEAPFEIELPLRDTSEGPSDMPEAAAP